MVHPAASIRSMFRKLRVCNVSYKYAHANYAYMYVVVSAEFNCKLTVQLVQKAVRLTESPSKCRISSKMNNRSTVT